MTPEALAGFAGAFPDPMLVVSRSGVVLGANAAARRLLGAGAALTQRQLADLVADPPDRLAQLLRMWARTPTLTIGALRLRGRDGQVIACRADGARIQATAPGAEAMILLWCRPKDEAETTSRFIALNERIAALGREITERKRMEAELREQREWLHVTLASIGDAVITTDRDGRLTFMNDVAEQFTGWTMEEAIGKPVTDVVWLVDENTRQPAEHPIVRVLREGRVEGLANHALLVDRLGRERPVDDSAAPIGSNGAPPIGVVMVLRDVSERLRLHREIARRVEELNEADRRKDEFLAMLGHELRNPLAALANAVAVRRLPGPPDADHARAAEVMDRQLAVLGRLVDDLLDVARIRRGTIEMRREVVDLRRAVERAMDTAAPAVAARGLEAALVQAPEPLRVDADPVRLEQIVANLVSNALKYTPRGGRIEVTTAAVGDEAVVTVRDTGVGIDPALLPSIFDLFVQGRRSLDRPEGGLGIGLTLVRTLVEMHDGRVEATSSAPGQGSTFRVSLPRVADATRSGAEPAPTATTRPGMRILVVDDHVDSADMLATLLQRDHHEVEVVHDGLAALAVAVGFRPRLVLLDIGLPGMDGYAVATMLRHHRELHPLTIVALTGYGQAHDRARARDAGCDAHIVKPITPEALRAVLDTVR